MLISPSLFLSFTAGAIPLAHLLILTSISSVKALERAEMLGNSGIDFSGKVVAKGLYYY